MRKLSIHSSLCILIAVSVFILPLRWLVGWVVAAAIHELFHIWMLRLLKIQILSVDLRANGAVIRTEPMLPFQEMLCSLAGPVGGLSALMLLKIMPHIALCAAIHSVYNMLPVFPLDGGRAIKCAVNCFWGEYRAETVSTYLSVFVITLFLTIGVCLYYRYRLGVLPILFPAVPLILTAWKYSLQSNKINCTMFS